MGKNMKEKVNIYLCLAKKKSLLNFAFGLKNAGSFGGTVSVIDFFGTISFVWPSIISSNESSVNCND